MITRSIIGRCADPVDSIRAETTLTLTYTFAYTFTVTDNNVSPAAVKDITVNDTWTLVLNRAAYNAYANATATPPVVDPAVGEFWLLQPCCCPCQWVIRTLAGQLENSTVTPAGTYTYNPYPPGTPVSGSYQMPFGVDPILFDLHPKCRESSETRDDASCEFYWDDSFPTTIDPDFVIPGAFTDSATGGTLLSMGGLGAAVGFDPCNGLNISVSHASTGTSTVGLITKTWNYSLTASIVLS